MDKEGKLYLIGIEDEQDQDIQHIKLGYTTNSAKTRKDSMQTGMPFSDLYVIHESVRFPYAKRHEEYFHNRLKNKRVKGEWFKLTEDEVYDLINEIEEDSEICFDIGKGIFEGDYDTIYSKTDLLFT